MRWTTIVIHSLREQCTRKQLSIATDQKKVEYTKLRYQLQTLEKRIEWEDEETTTESNVYEYM